MLTLLVLAPGEGWQVSFQLLESLEQGRKNHLGGCSIKFRSSYFRGTCPYETPYEWNMDPLTQAIFHGVWLASMFQCIGHNTCLKLTMFHHCVPFNILEHWMEVLPFFMCVMLVLLSLRNHHRLFQVFNCLSWFKDMDKPIFYLWGQRINPIFLIKMMNILIFKLINI